MADTIPNLWLSSELQPTVLTPIAILRTQASFLGQETQGLLRGDVRVTEGEKGQRTLSFDVMAPAINNYRYTLLSVQHEQKDIYPAVISAQGLTVTETARSVFPLIPEREITTTIPKKTAYSERQFINIVQEVLRAPETIARLQSLIVRSNEETVASSSSNDQGEK
jgi:hypothetical protein